MNAGAITSAMIGDMEIETAKIRCTRVDVEKFRYACNFCGKGEEEVLQMVAGDRAVICDECVALCVGIFAGRKPLHQR